MAPIAAALDSAVCMNPPPPELSDLPGGPGEELHEGGQRHEGQAIIAKPVRTVVRFLPVPTMVNAAA